MSLRDIGAYLSADFDQFTAGLLAERRKARGLKLKGGRAP